MVVDDEEPVLDSFSFIIEKHISGFVLSAKARSGTEAIELAAEAKPDVVFMDIHMPGIDGLDTIIEMRKQHPDTVFILATAYERFDIAQRAIPLNIFSYLVKPITRSMLVEEFGKIAAHLDEVRRRHSSHLEDVQHAYKSRQTIMERFLSGIIWENPGQDEWAEFSAAAGFSADSGELYLFEAEGSGNDGTVTHVYDQLDEKIKRKYVSYRFCFSGRMLQLFPSSQDMTKLKNYCSAMINEFTHIPLKMGMSGPSSFDELHDAYRRAFAQLRAGTEASTSSLGEYDLTEKMCAQLLGADIKGGAREFERYWTDVFLKEDFLIAKSKMVALFSILFSRLDRHILEAVSGEMNPPVDIMGISSVKEWKVWAREALKFLEAAIVKYKNDIYPPHLTKALAIIHRHFSRPIKLTDIAEECGITSSYLSRLFSEYLNTSYVDYLNSFRIEQALVLLKEQHLSVKETAKLVGYQDPNYFSRIFRRYTNMSPTEVFHRRVLR